MSAPVIQVENLSKLYRLGEVSTGTLSHDLNRWWHKVRGRENPYLKIGQVNDRAKKANSSTSDPTNDYVYALKDINFTVNQGEVLGIIGRNGAGKSTLLKILSRVTAPNSGSIKVKGRIASLLEVGTGFHPELAGRENIFLNGAILGMNKAEIRAKFDEIVDFSGCAAYLDTPVKRYSSGMYVRLAFAVAAHLEPEILVVDEVLAVGDSQFQNKCLGKMQDVAKSGRTILFVSHNMAAVGRLCDRCLLLNNGGIELDAPTDQAVQQYLSIGQQSTGCQTWDNSSKNTQDHRFRVHALRVLDAQDSVTGHVDIRKPLWIELDYELMEDLSECRIAFRLLANDGTLVFTAADSADDSYDNKPSTKGRYKTRCKIPARLLNEGGYGIRIGADIPFQKVLFEFDEDGAVAFTVEQTGGVNARFPEKWPGVICPQLEWSTIQIPHRCL